MPVEMRKHLRLPLVDMGVDGVFLKSTNEPVTYQSKFRTGRPALTWRELSTFYGLADSSKSKLVFTNCDEIAKVAEERLGAIFVRGNDLDALLPDDFSIIEDWLSERPSNPKKKDPKPHQTAAINDIVKGLAGRSRATALMACGTGKTLVALWVAEELGARTILVLLPSLALVRQSLHEWLRETQWEAPEFLCVCSDPTVSRGSDSLIVRPSEVNFSVTTESDELRKFLQRRTERVRFVFSTYHSSPAIAEAIKGLDPFDFAVFDEAHKTAGRDGLKFGTALQDSKIPIRRRLFLTATPRHFDVARKDKFGESRIVFSMDSPEIYGAVVHRLSFREASKQGIITDYKVIISVVTSEMVTDEAIRRGVVLVEGDEVKARQVANQIAVKSAIDKYGVSKVFTFHTKVASAKSFTSEGAEGIETHLEEFHATHIEGAMSTAYRERLLREFASTPRAILSNARCLTEGVDVPAVDMVAFLSPKRSLVDIVQATGRAMRLSPETKKEIGYVLVPLYVEKARGETVEKAVLRSNFDEIWKVLQGLKEQDEMLAQTIAEMRIEKGRTGGFDDTRFRERVEILGPELSLEVLRQTISAACIEMVGETWFERYGQLHAYHQSHGNCDIPARYAENKHLAKWVVDQRVRFRSGVLETEKIELLNRLGFKWEPRASSWRSRYLELVEYKRRFGNCMVPQDWPENPQLAKWVSTQRMVYSRRKISQDRIEQLNKLDFEWTGGSETWEQRFQELCTFKAEFGHTRVKAKYPPNPALGYWVAGQRYDKRRNELTPDRIERLDSIGFEWEVRVAAQGKASGTRALEKRWNEMLERFKAYAEVNGPETVKVADEDSKRLNRWVLSQRSLRRRGRLSARRIQLLDELGFWWDRPSRVTSGKGGRTELEAELHRRTWDEMCRELVEFFKVHGHSDVPDDWSAQPLLPLWVTQQRSARHDGRLDPQQIEELNTIGFTWNAYDAEWEAMLRRLIDYMTHQERAKGRTTEPKGQLKRWMLTQRQLRKKGKLRSDREQRLNQIAFEWDPYSARWREMFSRLCSYRAEHGDCRVPAKWSEDTKLANWVQTQRAKKSEGKLSKEQVSDLEGIEFDWNPGQSGPRGSRAAWDIMYQQLQEYYRVHGHAAVPQTYPENQKLGWWVTTQRQKFRYGLLDQDQLQRLNDLGFEPGATNREWNRMFEKLKASLENRFGEGSEGRSIEVELRRWMLTQRQLKKRGQLPEDRQKQLDSVGFDWSPFSTAWDEMFSRLEIYHSENGHCRVPATWSLDSKLANWVATQRARKKDGKLRPDRESRLASLNFDWNPGRGSKRKKPERDTEQSDNVGVPSAAEWDELFLELVEYKNAHGDCLVPQRWKHSPRLADWVSRLRVANNHGELAPDAFEALSEIGFEWDPIGARWEEKFDQLLKFKELHGHTNVSQTTPEYQELANWVKNQRRAKLKNSASFGERSKRLEAIGFEWRLKTPNIWEVMFGKLLEFREIHGHCNVPQKWAEDKKLGRWVNTQRIHYRRGDIPDPERIRRLEAIGFVWNTKPGDKESDNAHDDDSE